MAVTSVDTALLWSLSVLFDLFLNFPSLISFWRAFIARTSNILNIGSPFIRFSEHKQGGAFSDVSSMLLVAYTSHT